VNTKYGVDITLLCLEAQTLATAILNLGKIYPQG